MSTATPRALTVRAGAREAGALVDEAFAGQTMRGERARTAVSLRVQLPRGVPAAEAVRVARAAKARDVGTLTVAIDGAMPAGDDAAALADAFDAAELTLHSHDARVHDAMLRSAGAHDGVMRWLASADGPVALHVPVWHPRTQSAAALVGAVAAARGARPWSVQLFLAPVLPDGPNGRVVAPPDAAALSRQVAAFVDAAAAAGVALSLGPRSGLARCHVPRRLRAGTETVAVDVPTPLPGACAACAARDVCAGPRAWYATLHGDEAVRPLDAAAAGRPAARDWARYRDALRVLESVPFDAAGGDDEAGRGDDALWAALGFTGERPEGGAAPLDTSEEVDVALAVEQRLSTLGVDRIEELAFRVGLKPVLYLTPRFEDLDALLVRYGADEVEVVDPRRESTMAPGVSRAHAHLFVSSRRALVERCGAIYRYEDPTRLAEEMGALMGYPACCAAAFAESRDNSDDSANICAVWHRTGGVRHALLNLAAAHLVPFFPCSFSCDAAHAVAQRTAAALYGDALERAHLLRRMSQPLLFFDKDRAATIEGDIAGADVHVRRARLTRRSGGADPRDATRMRRSTGAALARVLGPVLRPDSVLTVADSLWESRPASGNKPASAGSGTLRFGRVVGAPGVLLRFEVS